MKIIATDLDGTIYLQSKIIPGVKDSIHEAKKNNFRIIFITNNSSNDHEFKDGNGAIVREIESLVGSSINSFGKPDSFYSEYLLKQFPQIFAVIGDRVDTDILLAKDIDAKSYLVNSSIKNYLDEDI